MRIGTALNHQDRYLQRIRGLYHHCQVFCLHADDRLNKVTDLWREINSHKGLPRHVHAFLAGYERCLWERHWEQLDWVFPWDGKIYPGWGELPEEGREYYKRPGSAGFHVYKSNQSKVFTGDPELFDKLLKGEVV